MHFTRILNLLYRRLNAVTKVHRQHVPLVGLRILPYNDLGGSKSNFQKAGGGALKFNMQKEKKKKRSGGAILVSFLEFHRTFVVSDTERGGGGVTPL